MRKVSLIYLLFTVVLSACGNANTEKLDEPISTFGKEQLQMGESITMDGVEIQLSGKKLAEKYKDLRIIDVHNHDSFSYNKSFQIWDQYHIGKIVLFGSVSEPEALFSDANTWLAYQEHPDRIYPFFSGFHILESSGLDTVRHNLEQGFLGIGETYAASTYSTYAYVKWKGEHPMYGNLPKVYEIAGEYKVPVLLHIDPTTGFPVRKFEEALEQYRKTIFIFAHANAYNLPSNIDKLMAKHPNLYIDFFAGFTAYNPASSGSGIADFIPLIEKYPDRFFLSTDSGFDLEYEQALSAMYETIELLKPETQKMVASENFQNIIDAQHPTQTQLKRYKQLGGTEAESKLTQLSRHEMNNLIFELEEHLPLGLQKPTDFELKRYMELGGEKLNNELAEISRLDVIRLIYDLEMAR